MAKSSYVKLSITADHINMRIEAKIAVEDYTKAFYFLRDRNGAVGDEDLLMR